MPSTDSRLIAWMEKPDSYAHGPEQVRHVQTHISHVFLAGPLVYKIRKPVDFDFLDFSTLDKRRRDCLREVELNRRLCPDIYLGVVPLRPGRPIGEGEEQAADDAASAEASRNGEDTPTEYAVKMKRLPEKYFLHAWMERGELERGMLDRIAQRLADFYLSREPGEEVRKWGDPEVVRYNTEENFSQTRRFVGRTLSAAAFRAIRRYTRRWIGSHEELLRLRMREGCVVDGHGDLHLDHIHVTEDSICIYDCIEFNERFRCGDWAADLAYLFMDLEFNGRWQEARYLAGRMEELLGDAHLPRLTPFYQCYRAYVKGKVKSLQADESEVPEEERRKALRLAERYFGLSLRYAMTGHRPMALILMGPVGSGKSTLARRLGDLLGMERHASDHIRKEMAGVEPGKRTPDDRREEIYTAEWNERTYRALSEKARSALDRGESVILDATYGDPARRAELAGELAEDGHDYCFVACSAPPGELRKRLRERESGKGVVSDARLEDFEALYRAYSSPEEIAMQHRVKLSTEHTPDESLERLCMALVDRNLARSV